MYIDCANDPVVSLIRERDALLVRVRELEAVIAKLPKLEPGQKYGVIFEPVIARPFVIAEEP